MTNFKTLAALMMTALMAAGTASAADGKFGADRHAAMGLTCETCHGPDKANPATPDIKTCTQCHNTKDLVEKTKDVKPTNPHVSRTIRTSLTARTATTCTAKRRTSATSATSSASRCPEALKGIDRHRFGPGLTGPSLERPMIFTAS